MKFDRRDVRCYIAHLKCLLAMLGAWVLEAIWRRAEAKFQPGVVMYGHSLSGNLKAFLDYALGKLDLPYRVYYATIDKREYKALAKNYSDAILPATKVSVMRKILNSRCLMTSHGPGIFCALRWLSSTIRFV
ncbi:MAG: hypothetical protein ACYSTF_08505, partial [Planctomycetota bacterium]